MPVILIGAGRDAGAGRVFICMPALWQAAVWAEAVSARSGQVAAAVAMSMR
jgi:hypothetical protein